ncbi:MAG: RidA family protein [Pseudomonadota bacterium]
MSIRRFNPPSVWGAGGRGISIATVPPPGQTVYLTGQVAWDENENIVGGDDVAEQTRQCFRNIRAILAQFGGTLQDIVEITTWYTDSSQIPIIHKVRGEFFEPDAGPASTAIQVTAMAYPEFLVEFTPVAVIPFDRFKTPDEGEVT